MVSTAPPPGPSALRRHAPKIVASLILLVGFVWMLRRGGLPLVPGREAFATVRWWTVPTYAGIWAVSVWFRSYRWVYLLRPIHPVSVRRVFSVGLIGFGAILFAPLRMGEVVRPYMIQERGKLSFTQATGTVAAERIIDGLMVTGLLLVGLLLSHPLSPLPNHLGKLPLPVAAVPAAAYAALGIFTTAFIAMGVFYWRRDFARKMTAAIVGIVSPKLATWFTARVENLADGLKFLPDTAHSGPYVRDTIIYWALTAGGMWFLLWGCGIEATLPEALVTVGVLGVGILVPAGPGFFGAFQLSIYCALAMFFPEELVLSRGAAYVFLLYALNSGMAIAGVILGFALERKTEEA